MKRPGYRIRTLYLYQLLTFNNQHKEMREIELGYNTGQATPHMNDYWINSNAIPVS